MKTYPTRAAVDEAVGDGESVACTLLKDGTPCYFVVPSDTPDTDMRRICFEIREGRQMDKFETSLLELAEASHGR